MHSDSLAPWQKPHGFLAERQDRNAHRTMVVLVLTAVMMVGEIVAGRVFGSMALLADGWHMGSHAAALGIAVFAYAYARRHAVNSIYTFGTGKVGDLAAFSSALLLLIIAAMMAYESIERLIAPVEIDFRDALVVAVLGLVVNLVSAVLLKDDHAHEHPAAAQNHEPGHGHAHDHARHDEHDHGHHHSHHQDHNLRAAYVHVLTDALTSVLAIAALAAGMLWGLNWVDAAMGIVGSAIIVHWAVGLMRTTGRILLDAEPAGRATEAVRRAIEGEADNRLADLHVWRVGPGHLAAVMTVVTHAARTPGHYKALLAGIPSLSHVTVEVERCCEQPPR